MNKELGAGNRAVAVWIRGNINCKTLKKAKHKNIVISGEEGIRVSKKDMASGKEKIKTSIVAGKWGYLCSPSVHYFHHWKLDFVRLAILSMNRVYSSGGSSLDPGHLHSTPGMILAQC